MSQAVTEGPAKKVDETFKAQVEAEKATTGEQPVGRPLKAVLEGAAFKEEEGLPILDHTKVLVITYDPATRDVAVNRVQGVSGMFDMISVLRDTIYQLEQMEATRKTATTAAIMIDGQLKRYNAAQAVRGRH